MTRRDLPYVITLAALIWAACLTPAALIWWATR